MPPRSIGFSEGDAWLMKAPIIRRQRQQYWECVGDNAFHL